MNNNESMQWMNEKRQLMISQSSESAYTRRTRDIDEALMRQLLLSTTAKNDHLLYQSIEATQQQSKAA
jgi:hypothetical protein